jgi:hypothetical protein
MAFNLSNKASFQDFLNFANRTVANQGVEFNVISNEMSKGVPNAFARAGTTGVGAQAPAIKVTEALLSSPIKPVEAQSIFLHEVGHLVNFNGVAAYPTQEARHVGEFIADSYAASMMGTVSPLKSGLTKLVKGQAAGLEDTATHPAHARRMSNLDELHEVIKEVGKDKSIPEKLKHLSKEDRVLARKLIPFEVHAARKGFYTDPDVISGRTPEPINQKVHRSVQELFERSSYERSVRTTGKKLSEDFTSTLEKTGKVPSWYSEVGEAGNLNRELHGAYDYYLMRSSTAKQNFEITRKANRPKIEEVPKKIISRDASIDSSIERALERVKASKGLYSLPVAEGSSQAEYMAKVSSGYTEPLMGKVANDLPAPLSKLEELSRGGVAAMPSYGSGTRLLSAATEASAAVASGTGGSRVLRAAGAALNILKSRL